MKIIGSRKEIEPLIAGCLSVYRTSDTGAFIEKLHTDVLKKKVRFPVLEYAARELFARLPAKDIITITDEIVALDEIGSYVLAGMILQCMLPGHYNKAMKKAMDYIVLGNEWYVCDIIGERVMGHALLQYPDQTLPVLQKLATNEDKWLVRCIGVAAHYAIKKGLKKQYVAGMFELLLSLSNATEFHTKKGIGWAAKTTAKFHPDIITQHAGQIEHDPEVRQWFKTKIKIGLGRSDKYAHRYNS